MVIHYDGEMIGRHPVRLQQYFVVYRRRGETDFASHHVGEADHLVRVHFDTYDVGGTRSDQLLDLFGEEVQGILHFCTQRMVVLRRRILCRFIFAAHFLQFFRRVERIISMSFLHQLVRIIFIESLCLPFALPVGAIGAGTVRSFVGFQSAPLKTLEDIFFRTRNIAGLVRIFDTKDKVSAMLAGEQVII